MKNRKIHSGQFLGSPEPTIHRMQHTEYCDLSQLPLPAGFFWATWFGDRFACHANLYLEMAE